MDKHEAELVLWYRHKGPAPRSTRLGGQKRRMDWDDPNGRPNCRRWPLHYMEQAIPTQSYWLEVMLRSKRKGQDYRVLGDLQRWWREDYDKRRNVRYWEKEVVLP